jgi:hypothetical protein
MAFKTLIWVIIRYNEVIYMKVKIIKNIQEGETSGLDLTIRQKLKQIQELNKTIDELARKANELRAQLPDEKGITTYKGLLDACSHLKDAVDGKRTEP